MLRCTLVAMVVLVTMLSAAAEVMEARPLRAARQVMEVFIVLVLAGLFAGGEDECEEAKVLDGEKRMKVWGNSCMLVCENLI